MPTAYVAALARKGKGTVADLEKKWEKAVDIAEESGHKGDYAYITGIFQQMTGEKKKSAYMVFRKLAESPYASNTKTTGQMGMAANRQPFLPELPEGDDAYGNITPERNTGTGSNINWPGNPLPDETTSEEKELKNTPTTNYFPGN